MVRFSVDCWCDYLGYLYNLLILLMFYILARQLHYI